MDFEAPSAANELPVRQCPHLAVDLVLVTIEDDRLKVLMELREGEPFAGQFVLPGGFLEPNDMLEDVARRVLVSRTGLRGKAVELLHGFSAPGRDPRGWAVSLAYLALAPAAEIEKAREQNEALHLVTIEPDDVHDVSLVLEGRTIEVGFDHQAMVATAVRHVRCNLDRSMVPFGLLAQEFTLLELQRVHEVLLGRELLKPPFRKKMLSQTFADGRRLAPTGRFVRAGRHRPAELYHLTANSTGSRAKS